MARGHQSVALKPLKALKALKALKTKHTSQIKIVLHVCPRGSFEPAVGASVHRTVLNGFAMEIIFEASDREIKRVKQLHFKRANASGLT